MFVSINRLQRCVQIWRLLCDQIIILETMTPLDFMEFRSYLSPASGFQSLQFRLIENKLGLTEKSRVVYNQGSYKNAFPSSHEQMELSNSLDEPTLLVVIEVSEIRVWREQSIDNEPFLEMAWTHTRSGRFQFQLLGSIQTSSGSVHRLSAKQCWGRSLMIGASKCIHVLSFFRRNQIRLLVMPHWKMWRRLRIPFVHSSTRNFINS